LILESEVNRRLLESDFQQLRAATSWLGEAKRLGQRARPWWPILASAAGFLAVRGFRNSSPFLSRTGSLLNLITTTYSLWKKTHPKPGDDADETAKPTR
jgi:hypothetical protein